MKTKLIATSVAIMLAATVNVHACECKPGQGTDQEALFGEAADLADKLGEVRVEVGQLWPMIAHDTAQYRDTLGIFQTVHPHVDAEKFVQNSCIIIGQEASEVCDADKERNIVTDVMDAINRLTVLMIQISSVKSEE
ncbi:MAG: hypothetical protein LBJ69_02640 [Holosporales bacterium]|jgi:hypothetical protein|nr:hypothetical protein [Holosporales bacterium]